MSFQQREHHPAKQYQHQMHQACDYTVQSNLSAVFSAESKILGEKVLSATVESVFYCSIFTIHYSSTRLLFIVVSQKANNTLSPDWYCLIFSFWLFKEA